MTATSSTIVPSLPASSPARGIRDFEAEGGLRGASATDAGRYSQDGRALQGAVDIVERIRRYQEE